MEEGNIRDSTVLVSRDMGSDVKILDERTTLPVLRVEGNWGSILTVDSNLYLRQK